MKKKYRKIVVDGIDYAWGVEGNYYRFLKIWINKKVIYREEISDDITPQKVADIIREIELKRIRKEKLKKLNKLNG